MSEEKKKQSIWSMIPGGILGGIGLVSLLAGMVDLSAQVETLVNGYRSITGPIVDFVLGWLFELLGWKLLPWMKDYFSLGFIYTTAGYVSVARTGVERFPGFANVRLRNHIIAYTSIVLVWPLVVLFAVYAWVTIKSRGPETPEEELDWDRLPDQYKHLFGFVLWAFIIIMINYGLIFSGVG